MLDVRVRDWTQKDRQSNQTLAFGLWNGKISIQVYDSNNMSNKMFRRNLADGELVLIEKVINKVVGGSPETKISCQFQKYDPQSHQYRVEAVFAFEKDSKQCYRIHITDCTKNQTYSFTLKESATMTMGNDPLKDDNLSSLKLETLKNWFVNARIWAPATVQPIDKSKFRNGGGGGGYGNRNGGGGAPSNDGAGGYGGGGDNLPF